MAEEGVAWDRYTVVGDGPERSRLEDLARRLGIADRVTFAGRLEHHEVVREVARADIFCLPSWREAFGVVYVEAMACGKPVIGCRSQGAEDIISPGQDGILVEPRDVASLASALGQLLEDPELRQRMGEAARRRSRAFSWDRTAEIYLDLYRSVSG